MKQQVINLYRIIQYSILITYLVITLVHLTMKYNSWYEFHNDGLANYVLFIFLISETWNISCWLNFKRAIDSICSAHNQRLTGDQEEQEMSHRMRWLKLKEKLHAAAIISMVVVFTLWNFWTILYSYIFPKWNRCKPFYYRNSSEWNEFEWNLVLEFYLQTFNILVGFGIILFLLKIISGIILLSKLKHNLYIRYQQRK